MAFYVKMHDHLVETHDNLPDAMRASRQYGVGATVVRDDGELLAWSVPAKTFAELHAMTGQPGRPTGLEGLSS